MSKIRKPRPLLCFNELISLKNLYIAHKDSRKSKRHKFAVIDFEANLFSNLYVLHTKLFDQTYKITKYKTFYVYEPKKREIQALGYKDRIVQHTLCDNFLIPYYEKRLVFSNCACRLNKGSLFARNLLKKYLIQFYQKHKQNGFVLRCDIKKYFANIDHNVLKSQLEKLPDKKIQKLIFDIIDSYNFSTKKGLPIGNQVSQIMGVVYMDKLDKYIKQTLKIKYYVRYMDDLVLIHHDKTYLQFCLQKMTDVLQSLRLEFNEKTQISPLKNGISFLGGNFVCQNKKIIIKLKKQSKTRIIKNLKTLDYITKNNPNKQRYIQNSLAGISGHLNGFRCPLFIKKVDNFSKSRLFFTTKKQ